MSKLDLGDDGMCFACGKRNPDGLRLEFAFEGGEVRTTLSFPKKFQGYRNLVHGGLLSTVLDEAMVTLLNRLGHLAVTGELRIRFLHPVLVDQQIEISARLVEKRGKRFKVAATAALPDGTVAAEAESTCMSLGHLPK
jgi:uncharacterized protein (TIGR00369 family)